MRSVAMRHGRGGVESIVHDACLTADCVPALVQVRVFKDHPDGVVSIKFKTEDGAAACLSRMNGR